MSARLCWGLLAVLGAVSHAWADPSPRPGAFADPRIGWAIGDFDGDHVVDVAVLGPHHAPRLDGARGVTGLAVPLGRMTLSGSTLGVSDVDADADLDLVLSGPTGQPLTIWLNDGHGSFAPAHTGPLEALAGGSPCVGAAPRTARAATGELRRGPVATAPGSGVCAALPDRSRQAQTTRSPFRRPTRVASGRGPPRSR